MSRTFRNVRTDGRKQLRAMRVIEQDRSSREAFRESAARIDAQRLTRALTSPARKHT